VTDTVVWHHELRAFECTACGEKIAVKNRAIVRNPERLLRMKEMLGIDHAACAGFPSKTQAARARRILRQERRSEEMKARANAALDRAAVDLK
jgi:DNA-directed RNA polymerase subunit RPC12/RpoP